MPKASSVETGVSSVVSPGLATPAASRLSRPSISTNRPDKGRFDQSAFAVTWNSTTRPAPSRRAVTTGVPSVSVAQLRRDRSTLGRASTCRVTVTSDGTGRPAKGEARSNGARCCGLPHDMAPPSARVPGSRGTASSGSSSSEAAVVSPPGGADVSPPGGTDVLPPGGAVRSDAAGAAPPPVSSEASTLAARRGPAKRTSVPPCLTHASTRACAAASASVPSAITSTDSGRASRAASVPVRIVVPGGSARST